MRFALALGVGLAGILAALALLAHVSRPTGTRWLGTNVHNTSDVAVYLSYLKQGADGHVALTDLFAVEPHRTRIDPVWSSLGLLARAGLDPIIVHEAARAVFIIILVVSLWFATRSRLATTLALGGISTGWLYSIWLGARDLWTPTTYAAPDLVTEFAIGPILFGGAHAILAVALLITSIRLIWSGIVENKRRNTILGGLAGTALLSFHPYAAPVIAAVGIIAVLSTRHSALGTRLSHLFLAGIIMAPPILYYLWLVTDPVFGAHHLADNILPLAPPTVWLLTLLPFLIAFAWMWHTKRLPKRLDWMSAWVFAVVLLLILLPVPWKRKLTEGLLIPIVFLTMPAWLAVKDWVKKQPRGMRTVLAGLFLLTAWFGPLNILLSELVWYGNPSGHHYFYQPTALWNAATHIRKTTDGNAVLISDTPWINVWLPSLTNRRVWIGHDHETPNFALKRTRYHAFLETTAADQIQAFVRDVGVTHVITTATTSTRHHPSWTIIFQEDTVTVYETSARPSASF